MRERLRYLTIRAMSFLPDGIKIRMSGTPPVIVDGQQLDPQLQLIRSMRPANRPGLVEPNVEAGRRRYRRETRVYRGPITKVAAVTDIEVAGLAARHYAPPSASADLLVYFHGGGFVLGDLDTHDEPCRILCRFAGMHVLSVAYRLAPEHPFPAALDNGAAALGWAQRNASTLGADPQRVSIGGDSAGANLSAVICHESRAHPPIAQLLIYPPTDGDKMWVSRELFNKGFFLSREDKLAFAGYYQVPKGEPFRGAPLHAPDMSHLPPALVITAGFDILRDEGEAYAKALADAGNIVESKRFPGLGHGFVHMTGICPAARRATIEIAQRWREVIDASHCLRRQCGAAAV